MVCPRLVLLFRIMKESFAMNVINIGTIVTDGKNKYRVVEYLASGGFADVYKALNDGQSYALKVIKTDDASYLNSINNEFDIASKVDCENAIHYYYLNDNGKNGFPCFIIMEYANGGNLYEELLKRKKDGPYTSEELVDFYNQLIDGMINISTIAVHRDIKLKNILISGGKLKISDYGLAKYAGEATRSVSKTMKGARTAFYYAPELWGEPSIHGINDVKVDIYAMGIVFYEIATLAYPYDYNNYTDFGMMHKTAAIKPFPDSVDITLRTLIKKMMEKKREKRFGTWTEIKDFLKKSSVGCGKKRNPFVNEMLESAEAKIRARDEKISKESKERVAKEEAFKRLANQIESEIYIPLNNLVDEFNRDTADFQMQLSKFDCNIDEETISFSFSKISLIGDQEERSIDFNFEAKHKETGKNTHLPYIKNYNGYSFNDREFGNLLELKDSNDDYIFNRQRILLWGVVKADCGTGINVAILEDPNDSLYGMIKTFKRTPNVENFNFNFPVDSSQLKKLCALGFNETQYTTKVKDFVFDDDITLLLRLNEIFGYNKIRDPYMDRGFEWI